MPALGVALLIFTFFVNILGIEVVGKLSLVTAFAKVAGITIFAGCGLWLSGISVEFMATPREASGGGFLAATALGILAYKGFTTITNSGAELKEPKKNVGRAIIISIAICVMTYLLVAFAVAGNLSIDEIVAAKNYALAEAARPAFGQYAILFTVCIAVIATVSGMIASVFAVSRMLAMLTDMGLVPHRHFGMPGDVQKHTLVYTIVAAVLLTIFFDLSRIAFLGAIFYIVMDFALHWGVFRHLKEEVNASGFVLVTAMVLDIVVLGAFLVVKAVNDPLVLVVSALGFVLIFGGEKWFLAWKDAGSGADDPDAGGDHETHAK